MDTIDTLAWLPAIVLAFLVYRYLFATLKFWETQHVRTVKSSMCSGEGSSKYLHELELRNYQHAGRIYGRYDGQTPVLTIGDPDILKQIMVKDFDVFPNRRDIKFGDPVMDKMVTALEGKDWKRVRSILSNTFTSNKLKKMLNLLTECVSSLSKNLLETAQQNKAVDINRLLASYTTDVIARCVFGIKINSHKDGSNSFVINTKRLLSTGINWRSYLAVNFPQVMKLFNISLFDPESTQFFKKFVHELLKHSDNNNNFESSFLKLVKENRDQNDVIDDNLEDELKEFNRHEMSEDEVAAQCCIFFLAGYHATNSTLANAIYSLAVNPTIQEQLVKEIQQLQQDKVQLDYEDIQNMEYLDCVINETLRMYPPSVRVERRAEKDYTINQNGASEIFLKKGMLISVPIYAMHHDPEWYPQPEKFDPHRFDKRVKSLRHPYTYMPFGMGPRFCVGMRFAQMQIKLTLVQLLAKYQFHVCSKTKIPVELIGEHALLKPKELMLKVELRKND